jgi:hypothetical protein
MSPKKYTKETVIITITETNGTCETVAPVRSLIEIAPMPLSLEIGPSFSCEMIDRWIGTSSTLQGEKERRKQNVEKYKKTTIYKRRKEKKKVHFLQC